MTQSDCARRLRTLITGTLFFAFFGILGCAQLPTGPNANVNQTQYSDPPPKPLFDPKSGISHPYYVFGDKDRDKPPLLLLHELPGLNLRTMDYAEELSHDFVVYVPLLFGKYPQDSMLSGIFNYALNGEWNAWCFKWSPWCDSVNDQRPVTLWLEEVLEQIHRHHNRPIGVIGMCMTGALPLELASKDYVKAVVLAQPTLPMATGDDDDLGINAGALKKAIDRAKKQELKLLGLRFRHDLIAKRDKFHRLHRLFGSHFEDKETQDSGYRFSTRCERLPDTMHSSLIFREEDESLGKDQTPRSCALGGHPIAKNRQEVRDFFLNNL